jgi:protein-tyrosine phosphatase
VRTSFISIERVANEVAPGVWQGGLGAFYEEHVAVHGIAVAAFMAPDCRATLVQPKAYLLPLEDGPADLDKIAQIRDLGRRLALHRRRGQHVGIFCAQGWNRSGIVAAYCLRYLNNCTGAEAMAQIKAKRRGALCNPWFEEHLRQLGAPHAANLTYARAGATL